MFRNGFDRARVVNVNDPQNRGRVQVRVLLRHGESRPVGSVLDAPVAEAKSLTSPPGQGITNDLLPWAEPCFPWGGNRDDTQDAGLQTEGFFALPSVGSTVWVGYDQGFVGRPIWFGTWLGRNELPEEITDPANIRLMKTPGGHVVLFDDTPGASRILLATLAQNSGQVAHTVRLVELNDGAQTVTIRNTSNTSSDPRQLQFDEANQVTRVDEGTERYLELDQAGQKSTLQDGATRRLELNRGTQRNTIQQSPTQTIIQDGASGTTTITDGVVTVTLNSTSGTMVLTNGVSTITVDAAGGITAIGPALAPILLGTGAAQGVVLDSIIAVIATMVAQYNAHTHNSSVPPPPPAEQQTAPVLGVNSSTTVRAKL